MLKWKCTRCHSSEMKNMGFLTNSKKRFWNKHGGKAFQKELVSWMQGRLKNAGQCMFCKNTPWHILQGKCPEDSCMDPTRSSWQPALEREQRAWGAQGPQGFWFCKMKESCYFLLSFCFKGRNDLEKLTQILRTWKARKTLVSLSEVMQLLQVTSAILQHQSENPKCNHLSKATQTAARSVSKQIQYVISIWILWNCQDNSEQYQGFTTSFFLRC